MSPFYILQGAHKTFKLYIDVNTQIVDIKSIVSNVLLHTENLHLINCFIFCTSDYKLECFIISVIIQTKFFFLPIKLMDSNL
jgi:hypothetical protein